MAQALNEPHLAALSSAAWQLLESADLVIVDLDGCLAADHVPLPGAMDFVQRLRDRLVVASNNSTHSAEQLARILSFNGLDLPPERFVLAGEVAVGVVARQWAGARTMVLGTEAIHDAARRAGLLLVDEFPDIVLLARAVNANFSQLEAAIQALHAGAALVVANPDLSHPGRGGVPRIETGALYGLLRCVIPSLQGQVVGKPEQALFLSALSSAGARPEHSVMVGDNPSTDIAGAQRLGMSTIQLTLPPGSAQAANLLLPREGTYG